MKRIFEVIKQRVHVAAAAGALAVASVGSSFATAPTLPTTGTELTDWIPLLITEYGGVVSLIVGGAFAFMIVWVGVRRARKALG